MAMGKRKQRQEALFVTAEELPKSAGHPYDHGSALNRAARTAPAEPPTIKTSKGCLPIWVHSWARTSLLDISMILS